MAVDHLISGAEVVGVDCEQQCRAGDILHVVPFAGVEKPTWGAYHVIGLLVVLVHASADVVFRLGAVLLEYLLMFSVYHSSRWQLSHECLNSIFVINKITFVLNLKNEKEKIYHRSNDLETGVLDVPTEFGDGPSCPTKRLAVFNNVIQIAYIVRGFI